MKDRIDYRELLIKYITLIAYEEGTTFIPYPGETREMEFGAAVTAAEVDELNELSDEVRKRHEDRKRAAEIDKTSLRFERVKGVMKQIT